MPARSKARKRALDLLYEAVVELLDSRPHHPLTADDVAYVHGSATSGPGSPNDYLDEFMARPRGVLVNPQGFRVLSTGFLSGGNPLDAEAVLTSPGTYTVLLEGELR